MCFKVSMLTSVRLCMILAALKWISSSPCRKVGEQVPQTNIPYVTMGTMLLLKVNGFLDLLG